MLYLTNSRPDLEYVVGDFEIYIQDPHEIHCKDAKIMFIMCKEPKIFGVHYAASSPPELVGFIDYDWDGDSIDRKSTSCYVLMLAHGPICW